tara:strand:- start:49186 stop:49662 length:477 start_codon:yes stop_codon:yes gene_type:complete
MQYLAKINILQSKSVPMRFEGITLDGYTDLLLVYKSMSQLTPLMFEEIEQEIFMKEQFNPKRLQQFVNHPCEQLKSSIKQGLNQANRKYAGTETSIFEGSLQDWVFKAETYESLLLLLSSHFEMSLDLESLADEVTGHYQLFTYNQSYERFQKLFNEL